MIRSKALKDYKEHVERWWLFSKIADFYYAFVWFFEKPIRHLIKLIQWYRNVFRNDYDFDGHCLFAIIEYKLKRVKKCLINGHAIHSDQELKALDLAIKLAGRLKDDGYDMRAYDRHEVKWGELKSWFTPSPDHPGCSTWHSSRPNAVTDEQKEQERKDHLDSQMLAEQVRKREERWLYDILHKYLRFWWD